MKDNLFSWHGRINRKPYIIRALIIALVSVLLSTIAGAIAGQFRDREIKIVVYYTILLLDLPFMWVGVMNGIKRIHDIGYSGWYVILVIVISQIPVVGPLVGIVFGIWLIFAKGMVGPNKFGADPLA